jgi:hypothetical protein
MGRNQRIEKVLFGEEQPDQDAVPGGQVNPGTGCEIRLVQQHGEKNHLSEKVTGKNLPELRTGKFREILC